MRLSKVMNTDTDLYEENYDVIIEEHEGFEAKKKYETKKKRILFWCFLFGKWKSFSKYSKILANRFDPDFGHFADLFHGCGQ